MGKEPLFLDIKQTLVMVYLHIALPVNSKMCAMKETSTKPPAPLVLMVKDTALWGVEGVHLNQGIFIALLQHPIKLYL